MATVNIVLASSSKYRAAALRGLGVEFQTFSPDIDETPLSNESPEALCLRLAKEKCLAGVQKFSHSYIIGSDQVGALDKRILTKPGNFDRALEQLLVCQGKQATFYTALAFYCPIQELLQSAVVTTALTYRDLTEQQLSRYLELDKPYDCAGSFKIESAGSMLFSEVTSTDPSALVGLPLIKLCEYLLSAELL